MTLAQSCAAAPKPAPATAEKARAALIDVVGCMVAGSRDRTVRAVLDSVAGTTGSASAIGFDAKLAAPFAALVNGTGAHALDFDDSGTSVLGHPTAVLMPALLALADEDDRTGAAVIDAYVVGIELQDRLGCLVNPEHYAAGWHTTSTLCAIGAAGAAARLLGLGADGIAAAMSIAFSMAGGSKKQFGSAMKPVHAGLAAQHAVQAARLARAGIDGDPEPFTGKWGLFDLFGSPKAADRVLEVLGDPDATSALDRGVVQPKRFPCCAAAHKTLDGILMLRRNPAFSPADVERVETWLPPSLWANLRFDRPADEKQARFSLTYTAARVLHRGRLTLEDLTARVVLREATEASLSRIHAHVLEADPPSPMDAPVMTRITLRSGEVRQVTVEHAKGSAADPLGTEDLRQKFRDCCAFAGLSQSADILLDLTSSLPEAKGVAAPLRDIARLAGAAAPPTDRAPSQTREAVRT